MFFYDCKILNAKIAPNWLTNVKVIEIMPNQGVSGTGPLSKRKHNQQHFCVLNIQTFTQLVK